MKNRYTPERQPDESLAEYRARRQATTKTDQIVRVVWDSTRGTYDPDSKVAARHTRNRHERSLSEEVGRRKRKREPIVMRGVGKPKRPWREGEPVHVIKPVRAARLHRLPRSSTYDSR